MILGIGIDTVAISRFKDYQTYDTTFLEKLFSSQEIAYCLSKANPAQHFASRFATREAFFKAHQAMLFVLGAQHPATLVTINKHIQVVHNERGLPSIEADWASLLPAGIAAPRAHVSMTHAGEYATAMVIFERISD